MSFRNLTEFNDLPLILEMHKSMWLDDYQNYEVRDFLRGGRIEQNPDILDGDEKVIDRIRRGVFNVVPMTAKQFFSKKFWLSGYIYLADTPAGIRILWEEPVKESNQSAKDRFNYGY